MTEATATATRDRVANLLIAGVGKSGTSSMFSYLAAHPEICGADTKEVHYFDPVLLGVPLPPLEEYAAHWAHADGERYRLEATPLYCLGGDDMLDAFERYLSPDLRVLLLVREPVERLASNFAYMKGRGALQDVPDLDAYVERRMGSVGLDPSASDAMVGSAWRRSFYGDYLGPWLRRLGPRLRLVWFDDLARDPAACVTEVLDWLDLDPAGVAGVSFEIHNPTLGTRHQWLRDMAILGDRAAGSVLSRHPALRGHLRAWYCRLNALDDDASGVSSRTRARLESVFEESTARFADMVVEAGYDDLPAWLTTARDRHRTSP